MWPGRTLEVRLSSIFVHKSDPKRLGLYKTRRMLRETLEWPTKYGPIFKQSPLRLRSGSEKLHYVNSV